MVIRKLLFSLCHQAMIDVLECDGMYIGRCRVCGEPLTRYNFDKWRLEWLDGRSPWITEELREVEEDDWTYFELHEQSIRFLE